MNNNKFILLRGISGSGKSTFTNAIKKQESDTTVCSADDYFLDENGEYNFDIQALSKNHNKCFKKAIDAVELQTKLVIIDNTNLQAQDYRKYINLAQDNDYVIHGVDFVPRRLRDHYYNNKHNVDQGVLIDMLRKYNDSVNINNFRSIVDFYHQIKPDDFTQAVEKTISEILKKQQD